MAAVIIVLLHVSTVTYVKCCIVNEDLKKTFYCLFYFILF